MQQGRQARPNGVHRTRQLVGKDLAGFDALGGKRGELCIEVLAQGADPRVSENRCHTATVSLSSDIEDLRHAV